MTMFGDNTLELVASAVALLIMLQLWVELRQIQRGAHAAKGEAFLQIQERRDNPQMRDPSFGGRQPIPGGRDEPKQSRDRSE